jgi:hypothetical protein
MDKETFQRELLSKLDQILELLSLSCGVTEACIEGPPDETALQTDAAQTVHGSRRFLIQDEMDENYDLAIRKWKEGKSAETTTSPRATY